MAPKDHDQALKKGALKQLREARKETIVAAAAKMKAQKKAIAAIKAELQNGDKTVPEIAASTGIAAASVLWYLATLKKYGQITESGPDGSYFRYRWAAGGEVQE